MEYLRFIVWKWKLFGIRSRYHDWIWSVSDFPFSEWSPWFSGRISSIGLFLYNFVLFYLFCFVLFLVSGLVWYCFIYVHWYTYSNMYAHRYCTSYYLYACNMYLCMYICCPGHKYKHVPADTCQEIHICR